MIDQDRFDTDELHRRLHQNRVEILAFEGRVAQLEAEIAAIEKEREGDSLLQQFLKDKPKAMENVQEAIFRMPPEDKKVLFDTLLERDIEIGLDGEGDQKWQIVRIPLVFKAEARDDSKNLMPVTIELVKARASMGDIVEALKTEWGTYRENPVF